jgi:hypothetical protein
LPGIATFTALHLASAGCRVTARGELVGFIFIIVDFTLRAFARHLASAGCRMTARGKPASSSPSTAPALGWEPVLREMRREAGAYCSLPWHRRLTQHASVANIFDIFSHPNFRSPTMQIVGPRREYQGPALVFPPMPPFEFRFSKRKKGLALRPSGVNEELREEKGIESSNGRREEQSKCGEG